MMKKACSANSYNRKQTFLIALQKKTGNLIGFEKGSFATNFTKPLLFRSCPSVNLFYKINGLILQPYQLHLNVFRMSSHCLNYNPTQHSKNGKENFVGVLS